MTMAQILDKSWTVEDDFGLIVHDKRIEFTGGGVWFNTSWFTYKIHKGITFHALSYV